MNAAATTGDASHHTEQLARNKHTFARYQKCSGAIPETACQGIVIPHCRRGMACYSILCNRPLHYSLADNGIRFSYFEAVFGLQETQGELYGTLSTLVIIFVHHVARSFCETIKLPKVMPKIILGIFPVYPG